MSMNFPCSACGFTTQTISYNFEEFGDMQIMVNMFQRSVATNPTLQHFTKYVVEMQ